MHCGFTVSIVPATGLRTKRIHSTLSGFSYFISPSTRALELLGPERLLRPTEACSVDPHPMQDDADLTGKRHLRALCSTPLGDVHAPALQHRKTCDTRQ